jgi:GAF domain-containing protein
MLNDISKEELIREIQDFKTKAILKDQLAAQLCEVLQESSIREKELHAIMNGSKAVLGQKGFTASARAIFDHCKNLIGATSGYVALLNEAGEENEVLFLEAGGLSCDVDPELPMPIRGLRAEAYSTNKAVYHNDFMNSEWVDFMPSGHVILKNVMFAPLVIERKTVGIIGLANKALDFNDNDSKMATGFGELAAIALQNNRNLDERIAAEKQREEVIKNLNKALSQVKKLSGMLPICSHCKKIRDDKGYWNQIEGYLLEHSEAEFSHSICKECAEIYYPDMDLYGDDENIRKN